MKERDLVRNERDSSGSWVGMKDRKEGG